MISSFGRWLMRTLLTNPRIREKIAANHHLMRVLFVLAHPAWGIGYLTEKLSPYLKASNHKGIDIQIHPVYHPVCGFSWGVRVLHPDTGWDDLGSAYDDLAIALRDAREHIDEIKWEILRQKLEMAIELRKKSNFTG